MFVVLFFCYFSVLLTILIKHLNIDGVTDDLTATTTCNNLGSLSLLVTVHAPNENHTLFMKFILEN